MGQLTRNILLSGDTQGFERLDLDVFCGIEKRDFIHLTATPDGKFSSGAIAQCADSATMAIRWKASASERCVTGIGAAVIPPDIDPAKAMAKRPGILPPPISKEIVELVLPEGEKAKKIQMVFLADASASMEDDIDALKNLSEDIVSILKEQTEDGGGLQMGLWHVAGGSDSSEQDLSLKARDGEGLGKFVSNAFDQISKGLKGGHEPIWKTLLRIMKEENWAEGKDTYRKIVVLSDEWSNADSSAEPLEVARMAKEKGIEIKIRGPAAVAYEIAKLTLNGVLSKEDYDGVIRLESTLGGPETRIGENYFNALLPKLGDDDSRRLNVLYANYKGGNLRIPFDKREKIDLTTAILDSDDEKIRLENLRAAIATLMKTSDPEYFDLIASYLKDRP